MKINRPLFRKEKKEVQQQQVATPQQLREMIQMIDGEIAIRKRLQAAKGDIAAFESALFELYASGANAEDVADQVADYERKVLEAKTEQAGCEVALLEIDITRLRNGKMGIEAALNAGYGSQVVRPSGLN